MAELFDVSLKGKTALVCGASGGIGAASARLLASQGAVVIAVARRAEALDSVVRSLAGAGHRALVLDLTDHASVRRLVAAEVGRSGGAIEILVNNSTGPKGAPVLDASPEDFIAAMNQHLVTGHLLAQALVPGMKDRGYGRIINITSTSVRVPIPGLGVSNTVRAAVASWAKTLSHEVAPFGITVNSVLPGYTATERLRSLIHANAQKTNRTEAEVIEEWKAATPARRFAEPEEIAAAVVFFASPAAGFVTGTVMPVDGGRTGSI